MVYRIHDKMYLLFNVVTLGMSLGPNEIKK